jgi:hypothetical protein
MSDKSNPLRADAEAEWKRLVELNGGVDTPALTNAAWSLASMKADRGRPSGVEGRDQEVRRNATRFSDVSNRLSTLKSQGNELEANRMARKLFFAGGPSMAPPR